MSSCRIGCLVIAAIAAISSSPATAQPPAPDDQRSVGAMFGVWIGAGSQSTISFDGRIGALFHPHIALFGEAIAIAFPEGGSRFLGGGVRLGPNPVFFEARVGQLRTEASCDFDDPCTSRATTAAVLGLGLETFHNKHAAFELRVDYFRAFNDSAIQVGFGGSFYL